MTNLYHGSAYDQKELMPGFKRSGVLVKWDGTESNEFLYVTTDRTEAISQACAHILEKQYDSIHYKTNHKEIRVKLDGKHRPSRNELARFTIFLYVIHFDAHDGWLKVNNQQNGLTTEWKTTKTIDKNIINVEKINLKEWLEDKELNISLEERPVFAGW